MNLASKKLQVNWRIRYLLQLGFQVPPIPLVLLLFICVTFYSRIYAELLIGFMGLFDAMLGKGNFSVKSWPQIFSTKSPITC
jgi:hypothetical protein